MIRSVGTFRLGQNARVVSIVESAVVDGKEEEVVSSEAGRV